MHLTFEELKLRLQQTLPGKSSHLKMAPVLKVEEFTVLNNMMPLAKRSAVLILLYHENGKLKTVFIKRSIYEGVHSGQISFPGGKVEKTDKDFKATALRETYEEIGVKPDTIEIIGQLTDFYIQPSNFLVKVFVGYSSQKPKYIPDNKEVQSIIDVAIEEFYDLKNVVEKEFYSTSRKAMISAPCYLINGLDIWGATAMIVSELIDVLNQPINIQNLTNSSKFSN